LTEGGIVALLGTAAALPYGSVRFRSAVATLGLITSSAVLVHLSGGVIEAHFHFFAMIGIITLYQDWVPFGLAIAFVAAHHGLASTFDAGSVYNHYAALNNPWKWAAIHGGFVLGASAANVYAWRLNEEAAGETEAYRMRLEEADRRRKSALEINDNIVQGLAVVTSALALGQDALARDAADRTIAAARSIITDLLGDSTEAIVPGSLRREAAAIAE
jgi:methyl-accepting chemotaxis protein